MLQQKRYWDAEEKADAKKRPADATQSAPSNVIEVYNGMKGGAIGWGNATEGRTE